MLKEKGLKELDLGAGSKFDLQNPQSVASLQKYLMEGDPVLKGDFMNKAIADKIGKDLSTSNFTSTNNMVPTSIAGQWRGKGIFDDPQVGSLSKLENAIKEADSYDVFLKSGEKLAAEAAEKVVRERLDTAKAVQDAGNLVSEKKMSVSGNDWVNLGEGLKFDLPKIDLGNLPGQ